MTVSRQRIDQWLVFARHVKTRSIATALIDQGHVRLNGTRIVNGAKGVKPGDSLTLALPHGTLLIEIVALGQRRGSATEAQSLYKMLRDDTSACEMKEL